MVGFLFIKALCFLRRQSLKPTDLEQKGAVIREKRLESFNCVSSGALRPLCYWRTISPVKAITIELRSMAKCALKSLRTGTKDYISNL